MPIVTDGAMMSPERGIHEIASGFGASLGASAADAWADSPLSQLMAGSQIAAASGDAPDMGLVNDPFGGVDLTEEIKPAVPRLDMIDALDRVKKAGLDKQLTLPNQPDMPQAQLEIMIRNAKARAEREATVERGPQGFIPSALQVGTSFLVGAADPINLASAFIPIMGELRYGKLLAAAGDSVSARLATRAAVGAGQGAVGQAALEPLDWWAHTQEGRDFGMSDVLHNIMFGAALGGALQGGGGFISDAYRARQGRALYPFGPGEPLARVPDVGTHVPAAALSDDGISADHVEQHYRRIDPGDVISPQREIPTSAELDELIAKIERDLGPPSPEVATINDLPPRAHEDAMRVAISDLINGEPVRAGDVLEAAARTDPRIAESFEAWHGSPHDFERFDSSKIGTGEGQQAYGHGLYFAENEKVARGYQRSVSDKTFVNKVAEMYDEGFDPGDAWAEVKDHWKEFSPGEQRLMLALEKDDWLGFDYPHQAVNAALRSMKNYDVSEETRAAVNAIGNLYKVSIKANRDHFLDLDKPLDEQSEFVRKALREHADPAVAGTAEKWGHDVQNMMRRIGYRAGPKEMDDTIGREAAAARVLAEAGIPGVKYLDQGSRDKGTGSQNFVVFNDQHVEITHKNGEPVKREEFLQQREAERTQAMKAKQPRGRAAADPETWSLFELLAHEGGLRPDPELQAIFGSTKSPFVPGFGALVRKNGRTLDDALRLAKDHGYLFDETDVSGATPRLTPNDLLDRLAEENAGRRQYKLDQQHATKAEVAADLERERHEIMAALHDEIEAATGQKGVQVDPALEKRVVEIVQKEGESDVLAAYERAIMEDAERYEAISRERQQHPETAHIAGWDPDEPAGASTDGGTAAGQRGQSGLPDQGSGRADGGQPRAAGAGDRGALPTELTKAADWRGIAVQRPDFNDPDVIAASNAAAKVEPPPAELDGRVTAATKAEAFSQRMYDMFAHRLPPEERARLDEALATLEREKADFDVVAQRGAACLFEGSQG